MEKIWHHTFYNELKVAPEEHRLLLSDTVPNSAASREKMTQIMFETFNTPAFMVAPNPVLSLYASGRETGIVLGCGESLMTSTPIYASSIISYSGTINRAEYRQTEELSPYSDTHYTITQFLMKRLEKRGFNFSTIAERDLLNQLKEQFGYVALDPENELKKTDASCEYKLPDGQIITFTPEERILCGELLFRPSIDKDMAGCKGVHELIYESISHCHKQLHHQLYGNVVVEGGSSMFQGFAARLEKELKLLLGGTCSDDLFKVVQCEKKNTYFNRLPGELVTMMSKYLNTVKVIAPPERRYSVWIGGSILARLSSFQQTWITTEEYNENGPDIIHFKNPF